MFYLKWAGWTLVLIVEAIAGLVGITAATIVGAILILGSIGWVLQKTGLAKYLPKKLDDLGMILVCIVLLVFIVAIAHEKAADRVDIFGVSVSTGPASVPISQGSAPVPESPTAPSPVEKNKGPQKPPMTKEERLELLQVLSAQRDFWKDLASLESLILAAFVGIHFIPRNRQ